MTRAGVCRFGKGKGWQASRGMAVTWSGGRECAYSICFAASCLSSACSCAQDKVGTTSDREGAEVHAEARRQETITGNRDP